MNVIVSVADPGHISYAESVCHELYLSSLSDKIGIAQRSPDYIRDKILSGKAVIALTDEGEFAGFSYIESWGGKSFVANSGLIVPEKFRLLGVARRIKEQTFILSRKLFPDAKIFSMTTSAAVMKMNYEFGFRPVTYDELTDDVEFWKGCEGCRNFNVLQEQHYRVCICTGLLYDPEEHLVIHQHGEKELPGQAGNDAK
ncbi:MAG: GNAT family N-acetyltransferase [Bacteroidales bacterium]|nr:GNAT family N-acetyltransferase [Bacteroidales bacterium]